MASVTSSIPSRPNPRPRAGDRDTGGDCVRPRRPVQHQIYLQVRSEIEDGLWLDRDDFPGERDLADRFGVSVITTRAALDRLAEEGWVERRRGRGTRAIHRPATRATGGGPGAAPGACAGRACAVSLRRPRVVGSHRAGRRMHAPSASRPAASCGSAAGFAPIAVARTASARTRNGPRSGSAIAPGTWRRRPMAALLAAQGIEPPLHAPAIPRRHGATVRRRTDSTSRSSIPCSSPRSRCTTRKACASSGYASTSIPIPRRRRRPWIWTPVPGR